jgi:hypothetical protein
MFLSIVPFLYSKRTAVTRSLVSLIEKRTFCRRFKHTSRGTTQGPPSAAPPPSQYFFFVAVYRTLYVDGLTPQTYKTCI